MPLPVYTICFGFSLKEQQPLWFIMSKRSADLASNFLKYDGKLVRFETQADAETFCQLLNDSYLTETFNPQPNNHNRLN